MSVRATLLVDRMGPIAAQGMTPRTLPACVTAAFARSAYLEVGKGLLCAGGAGLGDGPIHLLLKSWPDGLAVGDRVLIEARAAGIWTPPPWPQRAVIGTERLAAVRDAARDFVPASGLSRLVLGWLAGRAAPANAEERAALTGVRALAAGNLAEAAAGLCGLGSGLTPAGDDLLIGAMLARRALGHEVAASAVLEVARLRTHAISLAHLRAAACGMASAALHEALEAILAERADLTSPLRKVAAIGHSSGMDALAGILLELARQAELAATLSLGDHRTGDQCDTH